VWRTAPHADEVNKLSPGSSGDTYRGFVAQYARLRRNLGPWLFSSGLLCWEMVLRVRALASTRQPYIMDVLIRLTLNSDTLHLLL
jgi:hypothetical protein